MEGHRLLGYLYWMMGLLVKIFAFYGLYLMFRRLLGSSQERKRPITAQRRHHNTASHTTDPDVFEAEYRVVKD